jgi:hypothetical protein
MFKFIFNPITLLAICTSFLSSAQSVTLSGSSNFIYGNPDAVYEVKDTYSGIASNDFNSIYFAYPTGNSAGTIAFEIYRINNIWRIEVVDFSIFSGITRIPIYEVSGTSTNPPCNASWLNKTTNNQEDLIISGNCNCVASLNLTSPDFDISSGSGEITAMQTITAENEINNANVNYKAGREIILKNGFVTNTSSVFLAKVFKVMGNGCCIIE